MYVIRIHELVTKPKNARTLKERFGPHIFFEEITYNTDRGEVSLSPFVSDGMKFKTPAEAMEKYREVHPNCPTREDGNLNRPLTAYTVEIVTEEQIQKELEASFSFKGFGLL